MSAELLMGNQAIAAGAILAGVGVACGYPGTPSTEVLETVAARNPGDIHVEWSTNEKAALEVAAGAAYAGLRSIVTMKQVGLNVASDPLMSLAYIGVKGGMVVLVADDPGPISSQTEQDTRTFAAYSKLPVFDPASPEEAFQMVQDAFAFSEKHHTPVLLRPTTRVCHACAAIETGGERRAPRAEGFAKNPRWAIFPRLSYQAHREIEARNPQLGEELSALAYNRISGLGARQKRLGVAAGGVSRAYVKEAMRLLDTQCRLLEVGTPFPFSDSLALRFLDGLDRVLVIEELDPVIERALITLCGRRHLNIEILGKLSGHMPAAGENSTELAAKQLASYLGASLPARTARPEPPALPVRPPVLCAGCPHRASFYAVKRAMRGRKAHFCGDIGCYTLGNAQPLNMVDTCLCMGADVTIAQGLHIAEPDAVSFAFIGDSTFFHSGIPGVINAIYNGADIVLIVLDNATTAMTGHQPHPGAGPTMMGKPAQNLSIPDVLRGLGVTALEIADPLDQAAAQAAVTRAAEVKGVSAVIFRSPCIAVTKPDVPRRVDPAACTGCRRCIRELGCPALVVEGTRVSIDVSLCTGCGLCAQVCPCGAIGKGGNTK